MSILNEEERIIDEQNEIFALIERNKEYYSQEEEV